MKNLRDLSFKFAVVLILAIPPVTKAWSESAAPMTHYQIDPKNSQFFVYTGTAGAFGAFGHKHKIAIPGISGELSFDPKDPSRTSLHLKVAANSLALVADSKREEKDKSEIEATMREKVLEVAKFPDIELVSTGISATTAGEGNFDAEIHGDLKLHGVTRNIPIQAKVSLSQNSLNATGEFSLKQTDYQIQPVKAAGGAVKVKDEVRLSFTLVGHS